MLFYIIWALKALFPRSLIHLVTQGLFNALKHFGVHYLVQAHFRMWTGGAGGWAPTCWLADSTDSPEQKLLKVWLTDLVPLQTWFLLNSREFLTPASGVQLACKSKSWGWNCKTFLYSSRAAQEDLCSAAKRKQQNISANTLQHMVLWYFHC